MEKLKNASEILEEAKKEMHDNNCQSWHTVCFVAMEKWATQFLDLAIDKCEIADDNFVITEKQLEEIKEQSLRLN